MLYSILVIYFMVVVYIKLTPFPSTMPTTGNVIWIILDDADGGCLVEIYINCPYPKGLPSKISFSGMTILPIKFWEHIHLSYRWLGKDNKRLSVGIGILSFYLDVYVKEKV